MKKKRIAVVGSINADHIIQVINFPEAGETVRGKNYRIAFGGKGANQAVAVARSGALTSFIACVGNDEIGKQIKLKLANDGIDVTGICCIEEETTGVALIHVNEKGENVIVISSGANGSLTPEYVKLHKNQIIESDILLLQLESPIESIVEAAYIAKQHHKKVILNPAPARILPPNLLKNIDIITPNIIEAEQLSGVSIKNNDDLSACAQWFHKNGVKTVIITLGKRGVFLSVKNTSKLIKGFKVQVTDTIAAGDTFNGALAVAILEKKDLENAINFAQAAAAIAVTRSGAQSSIPHHKEIINFLNQQNPSI